MKRVKKTKSLPMATEPPVIPVGLDAYRMWDRWAQQRIGVRAYMRSTRDRTGNNFTACAHHYLYRERPDFSVVAHTEGPGVLYFVRANCWHGSPWHYETDGEDHVVSETATVNPVRAISEHRWMDEPPPHRFEPAEIFHEPLNWTWTTTRGADLNWMPIPFARSLRFAHGRNCYGTGYLIYHKFAPGAPVSQPIETFDWKTPPAEDVEKLLRSAGTDIAPQAGEAGVEETAGEVTVRQGEASVLARLDAAPATVRAFELSAPRNRAIDFGSAWLRVTWDDRPHASIDAPVALFFGAGNLHNRDGREYLVKGLPMNIRFDEERVHLACYFPMPYFRSAVFELIGRSGEPIPGVRFSVRTQPYEGPANHVGYFHATYADHPRAALGEDLVLVDTRATEGGGDWSGCFVGTSFIFTKQGYLGTLEGIPRFFFDDSLTPQGYGTGTEEWGGGGDYWGGRNMTLPLAGHPCGNNKPERRLHWQTKEETHICKDPIDLVHSAYRFLLADLMPFGRNALIRLEHGEKNEPQEHYETVAYWYGLPGASIVPTDTFDVADATSARAHAYAAPTASEPAEITSRYEWGVDHLGDVEIYPAHTERERHHTGVSEFTLKIEPQNLGVMLRRKFDYLYPNQRAEVFVCDASEDGTKAAGDWTPAGVWFTPGSNTCVFACPPGQRPDNEMTPSNTEERTVNRRFYESEFLVGREATEGRQALRVQIRFTPFERELWPGHPFPEKTAWSEIRYTAYCFTMPKPVL